MDDDLNSMSPMKRMSEYKEVDQMEHYQKVEEQCLEYVRKHGKQWIDSDFPPNNQSLFKNVQDIPYWAQEIKTIKWYRPNEIVKEPKFMEEGSEWEVK